MIYRLKPPIALETIVVSIAFFSACAPVYGQNEPFSYSKIYAYCLDANVKPALKLVDVDASLLSIKDKEFKTKLEARFKFESDQTQYPETSSPVDELVNIYKDYWRKSLLDTASNYDLMLGKNVIAYLVERYPPARIILTTANRDTIGIYLRRFLMEWLATQKLYTTGFGRTGKLLDLLIWRAQKDTVYSFQLPGEQVYAPVVMMDSFVTLGWEEYATLGRHYPGGWTTKESLFCVTRAYDLSSEEFLISYLAHEGRHFGDYKLFPNLKSSDLEYRAKLTELALAKTTLQETISFFINNSNSQSSNAHSKANYNVIKDMSTLLFKRGFEYDTSKWTKLSEKKIHKAAQKLLKKDTRRLQSAR